jgi:hypothetical protein
MTTPEPENIFAEELGNSIQERHKSIHVIKLSERPGGECHPDILVVNPQTNSQLGIEIKGGFSEVPMGVYPQLKKMSDLMAQQHGKIVVLTTVPPSGALQSNASADGIALITAADTSGALMKLEPFLIELAEPAS